MMFDRVLDLLADCHTRDAVMPPTQLYNEGWMLRLVLDWFSQHRQIEHALAFANDAKWYSEGRLPSQFLAENRGDRRAESHTHADGVIGHFDVTPGVRSEVRLLRDATQLVVVEAKMASPLSRGTKNAPNYDQAARNVGCLVHLLERMGCQATDAFAFYLVAPKSQIDAGVFADLVTKPSIEAKMADRVAQYGGAKDDWYQTVFIPSLDRLAVGMLSWESILDFIEVQGAAPQYRDFYAHCLSFNPIRAAA